MIKLRLLVFAAASSGMDLQGRAQFAHTDHKRLSMAQASRCFFARRIWAIGWCGGLHVLFLGGPQSLPNPRAGVGCLGLKRRGIWQKYRENYVKRGTSRSFIGGVQRH